MNTLSYVSQILMLVVLIISISVLYKLLKQIGINTIVKPQKQIISLEKDAYCNAEVQRMLIRVKLELHACKVLLARFHNGGCYANGLDMKKHTVTHETAGGTISNDSLMDKCVGVLNSRYGIGFEVLAATHQYVVSDSEDCLDSNFKADMGRHGFKSCYLFLIKQRDGIDEGFIGVNFKETMVLTAEQRDIVLEQIPRLLDLINMKENRFN